MGAVVEAIFENLYDLAFRPYRIVYGYYPKEITRNSIQVALRRLEKKGFIETGIMEDEICIRLTELGMEEFKKRIASRKEPHILKVSPKKGRWDGLWRVVVFDIPEQNRKVRRVLRESLRLMEFYPFQKSVWISKKNYTKELRRWIKELKLTKFIHVFETRDI